MHTTYTKGKGCLISPLIASNEIRGFGADWQGSGIGTRLRASARVSGYMVEGRIFQGDVGHTRGKKQVLGLLKCLVCVLLKFLGKGGTAETKNLSRHMLIMLAEQRAFLTRFLPFGNMLSDC